MSLLVAAALLLSDPAPTVPLAETAKAARTRLDQAAALIGSGKPGDCADPR
ncbi:hypothetical protein [Sphingomonas ginkgonis]|uniref:hypothetical protein n=1 Tax=Sphingomonas ginkgonis TaxID=2315330 RepID=UPI0016395293|nr:hypothetical protein [Sphingomonas ginkgonis]